MAYSLKFKLVYLSERNTIALYGKPRFWENFFISFSRYIRGRNNSAGIFEFSVSDRREIPIDGKLECRKRKISGRGFYSVNC